MLGFVGVTAIDTGTADVTVSVAMLEVTPENVDLTVVVPSETAVANPFEPDELLMAATQAFEEFQIVHAVSAWVVPSASVPAAANCWVVPLPMLAVAGDTVIEDTADDVNAAAADIPPYDAAIVDEPAATALAKP